MIHDGSSEVLGVSMATSSGLVALKNSPDFNRPVTLQVGADPPAASPHKSVMEMVCNSDTAMYCHVCYGKESRGRTKTRTVFQCFLSFCMSFNEISFDLTALLKVSVG